MVKGIEAAIAGEVASAPELELLKPQARPEVQRNENDIEINLPVLKVKSLVARGSTWGA